MAVVRHVGSGQTAPAGEAGGLPLPGPHSTRVKPPFRPQKSANFFCFFYLQSLYVHVGIPIIILYIHFCLPIEQGSSGLANTLPLSFTPNMSSARVTDFRPRTT